MKQDTAIVRAAEKKASVLEIHRDLVRIMAAEIQRLPEHLEQLTPAERVRFVLAVLPYTAPKVEKVDTDFATWGGWNV